MQTLIVDSKKMSYNIKFLREHPGFEITTSKINNFTWEYKIIGPYGKLTFVVNEYIGDYYITERNLEWCAESALEKYNAKISR